MKPLARKTGKYLCGYPQDYKYIHKATLVRNHIPEEHDLLEVLHDLSPTLSFKHKTFAEAVRLLQKMMNWKFKDQEDQKDHERTITNRVRCLCRVVRQGERKTHSQCVLPWVLELPWRSGHVGSGAADGGAADGESNGSWGDQSGTSWVPSQYLIKFNAELMLATRSDLHDKKIKDEPSLPLVTEGLAPFDIVVASWEDGFKHEVPGLTSEALQKLLKSSGSRGGHRDFLWEMKHTVSGNNVSLRQQVDHHLIIYCFDQDQKRFYVRVDTFGPVADQKEREPENSETLRKALAFMIPICTEFCEDKIDAADLKGYRDKCLKEQGISTRATKGKASKTAADAEASAKLKPGASTKDASTQWGPGVNKSTKQKPEASTEQDKEAKLAKRNAKGKAQGKEEGAATKPVKAMKPLMGLLSVGAT